MFWCVFNVFWCIFGVYFNQLKIHHRHKKYTKKIKFANKIHRTSPAFELGGMLFRSDDAGIQRVLYV